MKYLHTTLTTIVVAVIVLIALLAQIGTLAADGQVEATAESDPFSMVFLSDPQFFRHILEEGETGHPREKEKPGDYTEPDGIIEHTHQLENKVDEQGSKNGLRCFTTIKLVHRHTWEPESKTECDISNKGSTSKVLEHSHPLRPESTRASGCMDFRGVQREDGLCDSIATNEAVVNAVARITDLGTFPADWECSPEDASVIYSLGEDQEIVLADECLLHGSGADIVKPAAVVINGDLTEDSRDQKIDAFEEIYSDENFEQPLLLGLGNHDYFVKRDEEPTVWHRDAVERMSNELEDINKDLDKDLGGLVDHDMQGVVHLRNTSPRKVKFWVTGGCPTEPVVVRPKRWGRQTVRRSCKKVEVKIQKKTNDGWEDVGKRGLTEPVTNTCLETDGIKVSLLLREDCKVSIDPGLIATDNRRLESQRNGSMSYSFDIGNYHFVQLHYELGYEKDFGDQRKRLQGFKIRDAFYWLKNDLQKATNDDKVTVINVHATGGSLKKLLENNPHFNVVAVFAGHLHKALGRTTSIKLNEMRRIPVFRTGAGFCGTMVYVDFRDDYFDWAVIRAWDDGSQDADYIRPEVKLGEDDQNFAIGEPVFIEDKMWNCYNDDKEGSSKFGTVDFSALLDREPIGEPPMALCRDVAVDADELCQASASIDDGSYDLEGGMVVLSQDPLGPYGLGENLVTLTVLDDDGNTASCEGIVTVVDTTRPTLSCNVPAVSPTDAPLTITATATDNCSISDIRVDAPDCFRLIGAGRRVEMKQACKWAIDEENLTLDKTMGVGTQYEWEATAIDEGGNESTETCSLTIGNPEQ